MAEADILGLGAYSSSNQTFVGQVPASAARSRFKSRNTGLDLNKVGLVKCGSVHTKLCEPGLLLTEF